MNPLFPAGSPRSPHYFSGDVFLHEIPDKDADKDFSIGSVTFRAGARTHWHSHPRGQVLIITEGEGRYQEQGKAARTIRRGDVVNIPAHVIHWHGAAAACDMAQAAITPYAGADKVQWLEAVSEAQYQAAQGGAQEA